MIERMTFGGQIANAETIENPGLPASIRGIDLAVNMLDQIKPYGLQTAFTEVEALHVDRRPFVVVTGRAPIPAKSSSWPVGLAEAPRCPWRIDL